MRRSASILAGMLFLTLAFGVQSANAGTAGILDTTFGTQGVTVTSVANTDGILNSMLVVPSGAANMDNILVFAGGVTLVQYTSNGALDTAFGKQGIVTLSTPITGSLALSNGQIVIGGIVTPSSGGAELGVERFNSNGIPDPTFGSDGVAVVSLGTRAPNVGNAVLVYPSGDILVCTTLINVGRGQPYQTALALHSLGTTG